MPGCSTNNGTPVQVETILVCMTYNIHLYFKRE